MILALFEEEEDGLYFEGEEVVERVRVGKVATSEMHTMHTGNDSRVLQNDDVSYMGSLRNEYSDEDHFDDDDDQDNHMEVAHGDTMMEEHNHEPAPQLVLSLLENDVVHGRGGQCATRVGHQQYLQERNRLCTQYRDAAANASKRQIQTRLIQHVYDKGGRFLEKVEYLDVNNRVIQCWQVVQNGQRLYKKVAQALREGRPRVQ